MKSRNYRYRTELTTNLFSKSIDLAKGLAILLVLLGHIKSPLGGLIFSFHMPLFFFLAGIFIKTSHSDTSYVKKGVDRLLVPFLIFGALGLLITAIKNVLLHRPLEPFVQGLTGLMYWMDAPHMQHYGYVLWFLPALFWGRTFTFFLVKYLRWNPAILIGVSMVVAWLAANFLTLPFDLDKGLVAMPWILMGYVFFQYRERWLSSNWLWAAGLGLFVVLLVYLGGMQRLDLATKNIGDPFISFPYTLSMILLLIWLLNHNKIFSVPFGKGIANILIQFGQHSMLVLVLHVYMDNMADILVNYTLGAGYWIVTFAMSAALVYFFILVKQRFAESLTFKYL